MQGYLYKITANNGQLIYYGATTQPLQERFRAHKKDFKRFSTGKTNTKCSSIYCFRYPDVKIELIETVEMIDRKELDQLEGQLIKENYDNCVNKNIPMNPRCYRDAKYYYKNNYKVTCTCGRLVSKRGLQTHCKTKIHKTLSGET